MRAMTTEEQERQRAKWRIERAIYRTRHPDRVKASKAAHYASHKDQVLAKNAEYRRAHRSEMVAYDAARKDQRRTYYEGRRGLLSERASRQYVENREQIAARNAAWRTANPEHWRLLKAARSARERGAAVCDLTKPQWEAIKALFGYRCAYCEAKPVKLTQDHVVAVVRGGGHTAWNVVPACRPCNSKKHAGPPRRPVQPVLIA